VDQSQATAPFPYLCGLLLLGLEAESEQTARTPEDSAPTAANARAFAATRSGCAIGQLAVVGFAGPVQRLAAFDLESRLELAEAAELAHFLQGSVGLAAIVAFESVDPTSDSGTSAADLAGIRVAAAIAVAMACPPPVIVLPGSARPWSSQPHWAPSESRSQLHSTAEFAVGSI